MARYSGEDYYVTCVLFPQQGKCCLYKIDLAKIYCLELITHQILGQGSGGELLNRTNNRAIRAAYGDDTAGWAGKLITVFQTQAEYRGRLGPALRVRIPPPKQVPGNGQTAKPNTVQDALEVFSRPTPEPEPDADMDDEIPF